MKYVITGSLGHISRPVVTALVQAGHQVSVITSNTARSAEIEQLGAKSLVGSVEDRGFLTEAFKGADAVYTMVPPTYSTADWKAHIGNVGENYAAAIAASGVQYVVNLSSYGAHNADGCGPVSGLYRAEAALNKLKGVHISHLRPGYFYYNFLGNIGLIKNLGIIGSNFSFQDKKFVIVDPSDIADVAINHLLKLDFKGQSVTYIASDEVSTADVASILGTAIGKPDLQWVAFTDEQALSGALQAGLPEEIAKNYIEMGQAINSGKMAEDYWKHRPSSLGKTKLKDFAPIFAAAYNSEAAVAAH
jgi:uncharacterized protein YbjT (DUF2867 family)